MKRNNNRAERDGFNSFVALPDNWNRGITLVELLVTISIVGIIVVALGFSFQSWIGGYKIEGQIKGLYTDLMNARARAMQRNRMHFVLLGATSFTVYEDTDPAPEGDSALNTATDAQVTTKTFDAGHSIAWSVPGVTQVSFSRRGLANVASKTICSNTDVDADYNCIDLSTSRVNLGKLTTLLPDGGACDTANCVAR